MHFFSRSSMVFARAVVFVFLYFFSTLGFCCRGCRWLWWFLCCNRSKTKLFQCFAWVYYINWVLNKLLLHVSVCVSLRSTKWSTAISYTFFLCCVCTPHEHRIFATVQCSFFIMCFLGRRGRSARVARISQFHSYEAHRCRAVRYLSTSHLRQ